jgi:hypothetical protein
MPQKYPVTPSDQPSFFRKCAAADLIIGQCRLVAPAGATVRVLGFGCEPDAGATEQVLGFGVVLSYGEDTFFERQGLAFDKRVPKTKLQQSFWPCWS